MAIDRTRAAAGGRSLGLLFDHLGETVAGGFAWTDAAAFPLLAQERNRFLHRAEEAAFLALPAERRRRSYLLGRHAAKAALAELAGRLDPTAVEIRPGAFEQPVVWGAGEMPVGVSISHAACGACAVAFPLGFPLGIDLEESEASRVQTMRTQIGQAELAAAAGVTASPAEACTLVWTAKEALSKAVSCGMTVPFDLYGLEGLRAIEGAVEGRYRNFGQYRFRSWLRPGFAASLAFPLRAELRRDPAPALGVGPPAERGAT